LAAWRKVELEIDPGLPSSSCIKAVAAMSASPAVCIAMAQHGRFGWLAAAGIAAPGCALEAIRTTFACRRGRTPCLMWRACTARATLAGSGRSTGLDGTYDDTPTWPSGSAGDRGRCRFSPGDVGDPSATTSIIW